MQLVIDPGKERRSLSLLDDIPFSIQGGTTLYFSLLTQNGKSETRLAGGVEKDIVKGKQPCILWINGAGWRRCDRNLMVPEMTFLADQGYAVAFFDYRHSGLAHFPAQLIDTKTAVRFLRANAERFNIDPERIAVFGRSAGGYLAAFMAMEEEQPQGQEYLEYPSTVKCAIDLFGPVDLRALGNYTQEKMKDPGYRFRTLSATHEGSLLGIATEEEFYRLCDEASPIHHISKAMCPLLIIHGDDDALVPYSVSESFYRKLVEAGLEDRTTFVRIKGAGHGTREFFQEETKKLILSFLAKNL